MNTEEQVEMWKRRSETWRAGTVAAHARAAAAEAEIVHLCTAIARVRELCADIGPKQYWNKGDSIAAVLGALDGAE